MRKRLLGVLVLLAILAGCATTSDRGNNPVREIETVIGSVKVVFIPRYSDGTVVAFDVGPTPKKAANEIYGDAYAALKGKAESEYPGFFDIRNIVVTGILNKDGKRTATGDVVILNSDKTNAAASTVAVGQSSTPVPSAVTAQAAPPPPPPAPTPTPAVPAAPPPPPAPVVPPPVVPPDGDFEVTQNTDGKTLTITKYKGPLKDIIVPGTLYDLPVTVIGDSAFADKGLTSVVIPNSVITIGDSAFASVNNGRKTNYNYLTNVIIPDSVTTIGKQAFSNNQLTSVTLGKKVKDIGASAFSNNQLTSVTFPNSVTTIGQTAFYGNQLTSVTFPNSVTTIGQAAFLDNQLTSVIIPNSVTEIGEQAFLNNQLASVTIPNSVTTIGYEAFMKNQLTSVVLGSGLVRIGVFFNRNSGYVFSDNPLTSITVTKDFSGIDKAGFEQSFLNFYESQNRTPGTYVKNGPIWSKK